MTLEPLIVVKFDGYEATAVPETYIGPDQIPTTRALGWLAAWTKIRSYTDQEIWNQWGAMHQKVAARRAYLHPGVWLEDMMRRCSFLARCPICERLEPAGPRESHGTYEVQMDSHALPNGTLCWGSHRIASDWRHA